MKVLHIKNLEIIDHSFTGLAFRFFYFFVAVITIEGDIEVDSVEDSNEIRS